MRLIIVSASICFFVCLGCVITASANSSACPELKGMTIIGEAENVTFSQQGFRLKARIDTGAETSSLGITSQQPFERDGKKWVKFTVEDPEREQPVEFERPLIRIAKIKRHDAEAQERPVVKLKISLGSVEVTREFTLTDRSQYAFPVLIGRNVLSGAFLVDVNRKYSAKRHAGSEE